MQTFKKLNPSGIDWDSPDQPIKTPKTCFNCQYYSGSGYLSCAVNPKNYPNRCSAWELDPKRRTGCKVVPLKIGKGFRLEFKVEKEHFWSQKIFPSVEEAVEHAKKAIEDYELYSEIPEDAYLLEDAHLYNPVADCIYRDWLIYTQFVGETYLVDPFSNELTILESLPSLLQWQRVDRAKDWIDGIEAERHIPLGQLSLFES